MKKLQDFLEKIVARMEGIAVSPPAWVLTFAILVMFRNVLEGVSQGANVPFSSEHFDFFFLHSLAFYFASFVGVIVILATLTRERPGRVAAFVLCIAPLILLPPILDLVAAQGIGAPMTYRAIPVPHSLFDGASSFSEFVLHSPYGMLFSGSNDRPIAQLGINYGIRIEVLLELLAFIWYVYLKTKSAARVAWGALLLYGGLFLVGTLPYLIAGAVGESIFRIHLSTLTQFGEGFTGEDRILGGVLLLWLLVLSAILFFVHDRKKFAAVLVNVRPLRLIANLLALGVGLAVGLEWIGGLPAAWLPFDRLVIILAFVSVALYWAWAVHFNDLADEQGDKISMSHRPLPTGALTQEEMRWISGAFLIGSYAAALLVGYPFFLLIFLRSCLSYLYSMGPFRLKRFPVVSNLVLGCAYAITAIAGYVVVSGGAVLGFPARLLAAILIGYTLGTEFKDIKDREGDEKDGVMTIPVIFGPERGTQIIGISGILAFTAIAFIYHEYFSLLIVPGAVCGLLYYYAVMRRPYRESLVFVSYFILVAAVGALQFTGMIRL